MLNHVKKWWSGLGIYEKHIYLTDIGLFIMTIIIILIVLLPLL